MDVCCENGSEVRDPFTPTPPTVKRVDCGYRNANGIGVRITGDENGEAQFGEFPWMVAVLREETIMGNMKKITSFQCGGALIHPKVVLTAAHCISGTKKQFMIRAGEWDSQHTKEIFPYQDRKVSFITTHPDYRHGVLNNDIALLFLKAPVTIAENVNVVCLPPPSQVIENTRCFASGWGKDVFGKKGKYQVILKKIDLPIVAKAPCQDSLRKTRLGKFFNLHKSFICAGGESGKDTCKGDGGGPLVCPIQGYEDRYAQAGIVSWGIGCGENNIPGVYVNVALFRDWIDEQMTYNNLDFQSYQY